MSHCGLFTEQHYRVLFHAGCSFMPPKSSRAVLSLLIFWERCHGTAWLIKRMKAILSLLLGEEVTSIATSKSGRPKGPTGLLWLAFPRNRRKVLAYLRLHGLYQPPVTADAYKKEALRLSIPETAHPDLAVEATPVHLNYQRHTTVHLKSSVTALWFRSRHIADTCYDDHIQALYMCPGIVVEHYDILSRFSLPPLEAFTPNDFPDLVGMAVLLNKDGSGKFRLVYNPLQVLQWALAPLYEALVDYCTKLPHMYFLDQNAGIQRVHAMLLDGDVGSVDFKAASDNIPLEPQIDLLLQIFPQLEAEIRLFRSVSRASWFTPIDDLYISPQRGQPMGVNVSFLSFSLFLYKLLEPEVTEFALVGDDLVVREYQDAITLFKHLEIPLSLDKCLYGSYAEFCGTVISRTTGDLEVMKSRSSKYFTWVCNFGSAIVRALPVKSRYLIHVANLPKPVGFGRKPKSISSLPPELVLDLYGTVPARLFSLVYFPEREGARYAELLDNAITQRDDLPPTIAESLPTDWCYDMLSPGPEVWDLYARERNFLAESANVLLNQGYSDDEVLHHLTVVGNLLRLPAFVLRLSAITRPKAQDVVDTHERTWFKVRPHRK